MRTPLLLVLFAAGCTGKDTPLLTVLDPDVFATPEDLNFGGVVALYGTSETISVGNLGRAELLVDSITLEGDTSGVYGMTYEWGDRVEGEIEPEDSLPIEITFNPETYLPYTAEVVVMSNDPDTPELRIPLSGEGVDGPVPDISLDVTAIDFGTIDNTDYNYVTIENVGDGDLVLGSLSISGSSGFFFPDPPDEGRVIPGNTEYALVVGYNPNPEGDAGIITIPSNDPDEPAVEVLLAGNGGGENPVAVISDCELFVDPPSTVNLDGSESYDPGGYLITDYLWTLEASPTGSTSEIADPADVYTGLFVDMAGAWQVSLQVTNELGLSSEKTYCTFSAVPQNSIHVELTWDTTNSDLDLHLVQAGASLYDRPEDCCWCNRNPDWGESGEGDDPSLALDNRIGFGPENIHLNEPADGDYLIKAHYYNDGGSGASAAGPTVATVNVYIDGELVDTRSETLTERKVWDVGYISWPERTFHPQDTDLYNAGRMNCFDR